MARKNHKSRSGLRAERSVQPILGARHPVVDSDEMAFFFADARTVLEEVLPPRASAKDGRIRKRNNFLLYDDPDRSGLSILEQRLARTHAQRHRIRWTKSDVGRIQGGIQNELARLDMTGRVFEVTFANVVRLGDADDAKARKLALVPEQTSDVAEFLCAEHELAVNGLSGSMERFRYPYSAWIPHWTVGRVFKDVPRQKLGAAVEAIGNLLPLTLEFSPLKFISEQEVHPTTSIMDEFADPGEGYAG